MSKPLEKYTMRELRLEVESLRAKLQVAVTAIEDAKTHQGSLMIGSVKTVSSTYRILDAALEKIKAK